MSATPPLASPKMKLFLLLETLKVEAETFTQAIEGQVRSLAYVHGVLSKNSVISAEDTGNNELAEQNFGCMDVSRDMCHTCTYTGAQAKTKLQFDDISSPNTNKQQMPQPEVNAPPGRVYVTLRFDFWGRLWMMAYDGRIYQIEDPFPPEQKKQHLEKEFLQPEPSEHTMVKFAGKMMRTDIDKYFMACKLSNNAIEIFQTCPPEDQIVVVRVLFSRSRNLRETYQADRLFLSGSTDTFVKTVIFC